MTENITTNTENTVQTDEVFTITINKTKWKKNAIIGASCIAVGAVTAFLITKSSEMVDVSTDFDDDRKHDVTVDINTSE